MPNCQFGCSNVSKETVVLLAKTRWTKRPRTFSRQKTFHIHTPPSLLSSTKTVHWGAQTTRKEQQGCMCGILPHHSVSPWMAIRKGVTGMQRRKRRETYERPLLKEDFFPPDISETPFLVLTRCRPHWCGRRASTIQSVFPNNRNDQLISKLFARPQSKRLRLLTLCCGLTHHPIFSLFPTTYSTSLFRKAQRGGTKSYLWKKNIKKKTKEKYATTFLGAKREIVEISYAQLFPVWSPQTKLVCFLFFPTLPFSPPSLSLSLSSGPGSPLLSRTRTWVANRQHRSRFIAISIFPPSNTKKPEGAQNTSKKTQQGVVTSILLNVSFNAGPYGFSLSRTSRPFQYCLYLLLLEVAPLPQLFILTKKEHI